MKKSNELVANGRSVRMMKVDGEDYICLTDIARHKNQDFPADVVRNWMRSKMTVAFLGLWEQLHNPDFKLVEFDQFRNDAGTNSFVLPPPSFGCASALTPTMRGYSFSRPHPHRIPSSPPAKSSPTLSTSPTRSPPSSPPAPKFHNSIMALSHNTTISQ